MAGTGGKRVTAMPRFNPLIKDDRLLPGYCFSRRETPKPKKKEAPKEELISTDPEHVLSMEADTRKEWFQMALMQAATGVLKSASLYAVILQPAFASTKELKKMVEANMHFFSAKQQKELKKVVKSATADGAKSEGARDAERGSDRGSAQPSTDTRKEDGASTAPTGSGDASRGGDRASSSQSASRDRPHKEPARGGSSSREDRNASAPSKSKRKDHSDADESRSRSEKNTSKRRRRENGSSRDDGRSKRSRADRSTSRGRGTNSGRRQQSDERRGEAAKRADSRSPDGRRRDRSRGEGRRPRDYREGGSSDARTDGRRRAARRDSHDDSPPASERQPRRPT